MLKLIWKNNKWEEVPEGTKPEEGYNCLVVPYNSLPEYLKVVAKEKKEGKRCKCGNKKDIKFNQCYSCFAKKPEIKQ